MTTPAFKEWDTRRDMIEVAARAYIEACGDDPDDVLSRDGIKPWEDVLGSAIDAVRPELEAQALERAAQWLPADQQEAKDQLNRLAIEMRSQR